MVSFDKLWTVLTKCLGSSAGIEYWESRPIRVPYVEELSRIDPRFATQPVL